MSSYQNDDFWRQVKRTVHGEPVSQEQINMIVDTVRDKLNLSVKDALLDLGCGNGALSRYFFDNVSQFHGVDLSRCLIDIAKEYFEEPPSFIFQEMDIASYVSSETNTSCFTKCLCYGVFPYLSYIAAELTLRSLSERFPNLHRVFIGNLPDRERASLFYPETTDFSQSLDLNTSPIGIWRSRSEFIDLAAKTNWKVEFHSMPEEFYAAHYRYDAILERL